MKKLIALSWLFCRLVNAYSGPALTSISPVASQQTQSITIAGSGFGTQSAYTGNSSFISLETVTVAGPAARPSGTTKLICVNET